MRRARLLAGSAAPGPAGGHRAPGEDARGTAGERRQERARGRPEGSPSRETGRPGRATGGLLLLVLASTPAAGAAQVTPHPREMTPPPTGFERPDPQEHRVELDNGLVAYVAEDATVPLVSLSAFVRMGRADDPVQGAAEALVEGLRTGPPGMDPAEFRRRLRALGARLRVDLSETMTELELDAPSDRAEEAFGVFAALLRTPPVADSVAEGTMPGAPGEAGGGATGPSGDGMAPVDPSLAGAVDAFHARLYAGHPFARRPTAEERSALRPRQVRDLFLTFFTTDNMTVAVSGDLDPERAVALLRDHLGPMEPLPAPRAAVHPAVRTQQPRVIRAHAADRLQAWVVLGHELPDVPLQDEAPLHVMNYILGGGHFDTRLFRATRDRRGLTNDASGFLETHPRGPGSYTFRTYGRPEVVPLLVYLVMEEIERIRAEPVSDRDLLVARGALADGVWAMQFADGRSTARTFAREWLEHGGHTRSASYPERVRAVTAEEVLRVAREYLHPERMQMVLVGPVDTVLAAPSLEGEPGLESFGTLERADPRP